MTPAEAKKEIERMEYKVWGNCFSILVKNVRIKKDVVLADISLCDGVMEERHNGCEYPISLFNNK